MSRPKIINFTAKLSAKEGLHVSSTIRKHSLEIDEPSDFGGTDKGPNPVELVLAAVGGCQLIALSFYAQRSGVKLKSVETTVEGELDVRGYMGTHGVRPGFQKIRAHTILKAEGDENKIKELMKIAEERCPVLDSLKNGVPIEVYSETAK